MQLSEPILAVSPSLHGRVLAVLARTDRPLTGRTVASLVRDGSISGVQKTLDDLVRNGVVIAQPAGRAKLHSLNKEHMAYPAVNALAHLREGLIERISAEVDAWELEATAVSWWSSAYPSSRTSSTAANDWSWSFARTPFRWQAPGHEVF